VDPKKVAAILY
jgi:hypothetical protein